MFAPPRPRRHWPHHPNRCPYPCEHDQRGHNQEWEFLLNVLDYHYAIASSAELEYIFDNFRPRNYMADRARVSLERAGLARWTLEHYGALYPWMHMDLRVGNFPGIGNFEEYFSDDGSEDYEEDYEYDEELPHHGMQDFAGHGHYQAPPQHGGGDDGAGAQGGRNGGRGRRPAGFQHGDRTALNVTQMPTMAAYSERAPDQSGRGPRDSTRTSRDSARTSRDTERNPRGGNRRHHREPSLSDEEESEPARSDAENDESDDGSEFRSRYRPTEMAAAASGGSGGRNQEATARTERRGGGQRNQGTAGSGGAGRSGGARRRHGTEAIDLDEIEEEDGEDTYRRQHARGRGRGAQASERPRDRY